VSTIQRAYKTELDLNNEQTTVCRKHAGAARWAYNWGLARKQETYRQTGKSPSAMDLHRELNALKQTAVPWMYAVSKCAPQEALRNLDSAFTHFFRRAQLKKAGKYRGKLGYPRRKSKKRGLGGFRLTGSIVVCPDAIQLPRLGWLRLQERAYLPTDAKVLSATVTEQAGHWYVSVLVEQEQVVPANSGPVVGVDLGVKQLATLSDGTTEPNPRPLKSCLKNHASRSSSACSASFHVAARAVAIGRRPCVAWAHSIAEWLISAPTRCINSPAGWRKPRQSSCLKTSTWPVC